MKEQKKYQAMKKLILVLLIATAYAAPSRYPNLIPGYQCPADDVAAGCLGPKNCLHPNPYDCHSLIQCTAEGLAFVIPCVSVNLVYDDSQNHCDLLSNTKLCNEKIEEETDAPTNVGPTDPTTVTTSDAPTDAQTDGPTDAPNKWTN